MELTPTLDLMQYFARQTASLLSPRRISVGQYALMGRSSYEIYKPLGVVGVISPWNFPWATPLAEVVMALMAGNAVVLKPSELTLLTGSVATGKRVAEAAARYLTPVVLELGGKDPMIVLEDADIDNAALGAVWGAFANSGQACASVERCYVQDSIAPKFIERVVAETETLRQGVGTETAVDIGSMTNERQLQIVEHHVSDAE